MEHICKICKKSFESGQSLGAHIGFVHHRNQEALNLSHTFFKFKTKKRCKKCNKFFEVTQTKDKSGKVYGGRKVYCSRSCANSRKMTDDKRHKIKQGIFKYCKDNNLLHKYYVKICPMCNERFTAFSQRQVYCSVSCATLFRNKNIAKYKSKGELRLKEWLRKTYPEFDWKTKHLKYEDKIYEFDIHSKKFDDFYIEYNGPYHYKPIYGEDLLKRVRKKDVLKKQIMKQLNKKFIVVRVDDNKMTFEKQKRFVIRKLKNVLRDREVVSQVSHKDQILTDHGGSIPPPANIFEITGS